MGERPSEYVRDDNDWYVEPVWCVEILKDLVPFVGTIHDPCCGMGTIPRVFNGSGADLVDRSFGYPALDFLTDKCPYDNIITNPPYGTAQKIINHALKLAKERVAALVQVKFLASQKRHGLFADMPTEKVIMLSKRPSMPPGELLQKHGESIRGGGSIDFCWVVWKRGHTGGTQIVWAK
jgi:hypothetical protein